MSTPPNCPPGYGADMLIRFPLSPFFSEPAFGQDCEFSFLAFNVYGGVVFATTSIILLLHVFTLPQAESRLFTVVRLAHIVNLSLILATILAAWVNPSEVYLLSTAFASSFMFTAGFIWTTLGYHTVIRTVMKVQMNKDVKMVRILRAYAVEIQETNDNNDTTTPYLQVTLLGGKWCAFGSLGLIVGSNIGYHVSVYTMAFYRSQGDIEMAVLLYRIQAAFIALGCISFLIPAMIALTRFLAMMEESINSNHLRESNSAYITQLKDVAARFRVLRKMFFVAATSASLMFVLHATILPIFWWIELTHLNTTAICSLWLLVTMTSPNKRAKVVRRFTCGLVRLNATTSTSLSSARVRDTVNSASPT